MFRSHVPHGDDLTIPLFCGTFPWEAPEGTVIVEYVDGRWRVVSRGRPVTTFRRRQDALTHAHKIAALFDPVWKVVEREEPGASTIAC